MWQSEQWNFLPPLLYLPLNKLFARVSPKIGYATPVPIQEFLKFVEDLCFIYFLCLPVYRCIEGTN